MSEDQGSDEEAETGFGFGVRAGYAFTPRLSAYLNLSGARLDEDSFFGEDVTSSLGNAEIGLEARFPSPARTWTPYGNVGLQSTVMRVEFDGASDGRIDVTGGGLVLGGGVRFPLRPSLSADLGLEGFAGALTKVTLEAEGESESEDLDDVTYRGGRLRVGLTWTFGR